MARHRQPEVLAEISGAKKQHPERYKKQTPTSPYEVGAPPDHLPPDVRNCWVEIETYALQGVLTGSDRFILEIAAQLLAEFRAFPLDFKAAKYTHLIGALARLGLSPADRQKLGTEKPGEVNEFNAF